MLFAIDCPGAVSHTGVVCCLVIGGSSGSSPSRVTPSASLQRFFEALVELSTAMQKRMAEPSSEKSDADRAQWLTLAKKQTGPAEQEAYWLGEKNLGQYLYIRRCYLQLYNIIVELWRKGLWVLLLGSPGRIPQHHSSIETRR